MFFTDKKPNHRHGGLLSWAHPSGSRPLEDICTSSVAPGSFWHAAEGAVFTHQCRANWGADWPEGQWRRAASRAVLLSNPVMDTHVGVGSWPKVPEVLWQLMGHDEAGALVLFFCPWGCCRVYQSVRGYWLQHTSSVNCLRYTTAPCQPTHTLIRKKIFKRYWPTGILCLRKEKRYFFPFLFNLNTWIKHECIEPICCEQSTNDLNTMCKWCPMKPWKHA